MFNIKGNDYRLIVGLAYTTGVVFFKFLGTHKPYHAIDAAVETIKFRIEQQRLTPRDLEPMIGSPGRVSEGLSGQRRLSMAMVWRLHQGLGIAAETLIRPPRSA